MSSSSQFASGPHSGSFAELLPARRGSVESLTSIFFALSEDRQTQLLAWRANGDPPSAAAARKDGLGGWERSHRRSLARHNGPRKYAEGYREACSGFMMCCRDARHEPRAKGEIMSIIRDGQGAYAPTEAVMTIIHGAAERRRRKETGQASLFG